MKNQRALLPMILPMLFCVLLALISCRVYLQPGLPSTHDSENHLARFANYKVALKEGQIPPRFAPNLYHQYGYPVFNYNYPLPNILSVPFSLLKIPAQTSFKMIMTGAVFLLLYGMWRWLSLLKLSLQAKILSVTALASTPYLLQTVVFRGSIGEVLAVTLMAWWLVWVETIRQRGEKVSSSTSWRDILFSAQTLCGGVLLGAFFLSHNVTVLFGAPLLMLFAIWWLRLTPRSLWKVFGAVILGLGLSLWFWIPAMMEQAMVVVGGSALSQQFVQHFPTVQQLFSGPMTFGFSFRGAVDSLSFALGLVIWVSLFCTAGWSIASVLGQKRARKEFDEVGKVFFFVSCALVVFQLSFTTPLWEVIPFARFIQFPWRLDLFLLLTSTALVAWLTQKGLIWQVRLITLAVVLQVIFAWMVQPAGYFNKSQIEYDLFAQSTTTGNENLPKSFTFTSFADWQPTAQVLSGEGQISVLRWTGSHRTYSVTASSPAVIVEPTMFFPGWETTITSGNSYRLADYLDNEEVGGRIAYALDPGTYQIKTEFTQHTLPRIIGNSTAVVTIGFLLGACTWLVIVKVKYLKVRNANTLKK
jgi:hypothetical protein